MVTPDFIIDVTDSSFEYEVLSYSRNVPVVVDFWASWCRPCKVLSPLLEQLAIEAGGAFRLARLDVDDNPNIAMRYSVRSLPTVKAFSEGQMVSEFVGVLPEGRVREFLSKITPPSPTNLALEKGNSLLSLEKWSAAEQTFRSIIEQNPDHPPALLGLLKALLAQGRIGEASIILTDFPPSHQYTQAELLRPLADALREFQKGTLPDDQELDPAFRNCIRLAGRSNLEASLDGLLDILRQDRHYRQDRARRVIISLLEIMGDENPLTRQYRSELASILF